MVRRRIAMSIIGNAKKVAAAVAQGNVTGDTFGGDVKAAATKAIFGGIQSQDWEDYMTLFADNAAQLQRLKGADAQANVSWVRDSIAYLAADGMCGATTTGIIANNLDARLDDGLEEAADGTITKIFEIPDPTA